MPLRTLHFCEHTCPSWLKLSVHTPDAHSVEVSLTVLQVAPNAPAELSELPSTAGGAESELHAHSANAQMMSRRLSMPAALRKRRAARGIRDLSLRVDSRVGACRAFLLRAVPT